MEEFRRPFLSTIFYALAVIFACIGIVLVVPLAFGFSSLIPTNLRLIGLLGTAYSWMMLLGVVGACATQWAIGYGIELLARIAWNTNPPHIARMFRDAVDTMPTEGRADPKGFYIEEGGKLRGPFSAPQMLNMYRDGQLSVQNPVFVEENGVKRSLSSWKEIGL